jgi:hypothetical protein
MDDYAAGYCARARSARRSTAALAGWLDLPLGLVGCPAGSSSGPSPGSDVVCGAARLRSDRHHGPVVGRRAARPCRDTTQHGRAGRRGTLAGSAAPTLRVDGCPPVFHRSVAASRLSLSRGLISLPRSFCRRSVGRQLCPTCRPARRVMSARISAGSINLSRNRLDGRLRYLICQRLGGSLILARFFRASTSRRLSHTAGPSPSPTCRARGIGISRSYSAGSTRRPPQSQFSSPTGGAPVGGGQVRT